MLLGIVRAKWIWHIMCKINLQKQLNILWVIPGHEISTWKKKIKLFKLVHWRFSKGLWCFSESNTFIFSKKSQKNQKNQKNQINDGHQNFYGRTLKNRFSDWTFFRQLNLSIKMINPRQINQNITTKTKLTDIFILAAQVQASNMSENLLNEIRQIVHFLYQGK